MLRVVNKIDVGGYSENCVIDFNVTSTSKRQKIDVKSKQKTLIYNFIKF